MSQLITLPQKELTPEQLKLIRDTIAPTATKDELALFLYRCKALGLDPLKPGQIHFVKYGNSPGTIVVGIEGFRANAQRTGKMAGVERALIRDKDGKCIGAKATVWRKDWERPAVMEVIMSEYNTGKGPWSKMPETMIGKVAEAAALRMAFPDDLGGIYAQEEMDQAEKNAGRIVAEQPPEDGGDGVVTGHRYLIPGGKYVKRTIDEVIRNEGYRELAKYILWCEDKYKQPGKKAPDWWADFSERAGHAIAEAENFDGEPA